jgi:hypothetical protein
LQNYLAQFKIASTRRECENTAVSVAENRQNQKWNMKIVHVAEDSHTKKGM